MAPLDIHLSSTLPILCCGSRHEDGPHGLLACRSRYHCGWDLQSFCAFWHLPPCQWSTATLEALVRRTLVWIPLLIIFVIPIGLLQGGAGLA